MFVNSAKLRELSTYDQTVHSPIPRSVSFEDVLSAAE